MAAAAAAAATRTITNVEQAEPIGRRQTSNMVLHQSQTGPGE